MKAAAATFIKKRGVVEDYLQHANEKSKSIQIREFGKTKNQMLSVRESFLYPFLLLTNSLYPKSMNMICMFIEQFVNNKRRKIHSLTKI